MARFCEFFQHLHQIISRFFKTNLVRFSIFTCLLTFLIGLLIAIGIAFFFGPDSYNIIDNYISDLGSIRYTPAPFILDLIAMITAIFLVPIFFYFLIIETAGSARKICNPEEKLIVRFHNFGINLHSIFGFTSLIIAAVGLFAIGLFSEDRSTDLNLHFWFSVIVFAGLAFGALFSGISIILRKTIFNRILGIYMAIVPFTISVMFLFPPVGMTRPLIEWMMFFAALNWIIPMAIMMLRHIKKAPSSENKKS